MVREIVPQYTKVSAKKLRAAIDAGEDLSDDDAVSDDRDASDEEGGRVGALDDPAANEDDDHGDEDEQEEEEDDEDEDFDEEDDEDEDEGAKVVKEGRETEESVRG